MARRAEVGPVRLELGATLPSVQVAYETFGTPRRGGDGTITNAVLVLHALTGDANVARWWGELLRPGAALDPAQWYVVASNVLGGCHGTTGPSSRAPDGRAWGSRFPLITIRDQVAVEASLADHLGVARYAAVLGGSMGGMRALEWLVGHPDRVASGLVLATGAQATADQLGVQSAQLLAIRNDPNWRYGDYHGLGVRPEAGMGLARRIAQLTYRGEVELDVRFGRAAQDGEEPLGGGRYAIQSYLDHHAGKLVRRFDAGTYVALTEAINTHDIGRGRGGAATALSTITAPVTVAGIDTDRLYPLRLQHEIADGVSTCERTDIISSPFGHDAFLIEHEAIDALVRKTLEDAVVAMSGPVDCPVS